MRVACRLYGIPSSPPSVPISPADFEQRLRDWAEPSSGLTERQRISAALINDLFFVPQTEGQFILRISAVQALCDQGERDARYQTAIEQLEHQLAGQTLDEDVRKTLKDRSAGRNASRWAKPIWPNSRRCGRMPKRRRSPTCTRSAAGSFTKGVAEANLVRRPTQHCNWRPTCWKQSCGSRGPQGWWANRHALADRAPALPPPKGRSEERPSVDGLWWGGPGWGVAGTRQHERRCVGLN